MESLSQPLTDDPAKYHEEMMKRLDTLRRNERFCDVTVVVQGKEFATHKVVLSATSPFLLRLLENKMVESKEEIIRLNLEETTASVMEDVLEYIYTGNVAVTADRAHNVIATADYLLIPSLKTLCGRFLQQMLTTENCIHTYFFAEKYHCQELLEKSREFINHNFTAVMATDGFLTLDSKQVTEFISSDDIVVNSEDEVYKAIVKWVSQNKTARKGEFAGLFCQIRLISISRDLLFDAIKWITNATDEDVGRPPRKCLETHTDAILACGGRKTLCYLPERKKWYKLADSLFEHQHHSITRYHDDVYIVGGENVTSGVRLLEYYLPSSNRWVGFRNELRETQVSSLVVLKGYLYATIQQTGHYANTPVHKYDAKNNSWGKIPDPPNRRAYVCGVSDGNHLYLIGGRRGYNVFATTQQYDPDENRWKRVADMIEARADAFGVAANGKVYVAGGTGRHDHEVKNACEVYNPLTDNWELIGNMHVSRKCGSMVCLKGALYILGGINSRSRELSVEVYDADRNEWRKKADIPTSCETPEEMEKKPSFRACFARIPNSVINSLQPFET